jgi:signal transduction histidine kinase
LPKEGQDQGSCDTSLKRALVYGREALTNAFRHSSATRIELALDYGPRGLRMQVRDNGQGIGSDEPVAGPEDHWGLLGMRERAERIGAPLTLWNRPAAGTEVLLFVPAEKAFAQSGKS